MARRLMIILITAILWGLAAVAAVLINSNVHVLWSSGVGYVLTALVVLAIWVITELALTKARLDIPYEAE